MTARQLLEQAGKAPVLGWCDQRRKGHPVNLKHTDIVKTWKTVQRLTEKKR
jgi:hypothetical protein